MSPKPFLQDLRRPALIAHRGGGMLRPENTLEAFRLAVQLGADVLELDLHLTCDGEAVVLHDRELDRTTDGTGPVDARSLREVRALDAGHRFSPDGVSFPFRGRGIQVPTFEELLTELPAVRLNIELKGEQPELLERFAELVRRHGRQELICAGSALDEVADRVRQALPGICTYYPEMAARAWVMRHWLLRSGGAEEIEAPAHRDVLELPMDLDGFDIVDARLVDAAHAEGIEVQVWTLNDEESIGRALAAGVDGIMTDDPALLARLLGR